METIAVRDPAARRVRLTAAAVRCLVALTATSLAVFSGDPLATFFLLVPAIGLGTVAIAQRRTGWLWGCAVAAELLVTAAGIPVTGGSRSALLPYLLGPLFVVGFRRGARYVVPAGAATALVLAVGATLGPVRAERRDYAVAAAQWCVLGVLFGVVAGWARLLAAADDPATGYARASRLLAELRGTARRLPGSLDPVGAAETLLDACAEVTPYDRGAVLLPTSTDRLAPLAVRGAERSDVDPSLTGDGHLAVAWRTRQAVRETGRAVPSGPASLLAVPVPSGDGCTALVVLESRADAAFGPAVVREVVGLVVASAARLESALLFDEVRRLATVEERHRVAREIHDGIAQDLVYVGYELDMLGAELGDHPARAALRRAREHVTRVVGELRLSIFTLKSAPGPGGLGAALGEYVRSVGTAAGLAVHLSLSEDTSRLPADTEVELMRIAQDAVGNARKRPGVRNLWVALTVDPPHVLLRVEDDGGRDDRGYRMEPMRERAERLGATLRVTPRDPAGTRVEVEIGGR